MAVTTEQVAELYVSFFDRAPDADGLAYWVETGMSIEDISASFYEQEETTTTYPDSMTDSVFVNTIYNNMFNHDADPDGLTYWETELANDSITRANMILAIANGALGTDQTVLDNKTEVGLYFSEKGLNNVEDATAVMEDVDATDASVTAAKDEINQLAPLDLTVGKDDVLGTSEDDTINGLMIAAGSTYTAGDKIDGAAGDDTLLLVSGGGTDVFAAMTNVETVQLDVSAATTISAANWTGVDNYVVNKQAGNTAAFTAISEDIEKVTIKGATLAGGTTLKVADDILDENNDIVNVELSGSSATGVSTIDVTGTLGTEDIVEGYKITSTGNTAGAQLTIATANDSKVETVTVDGSSSLQLNTFATATKLSVIDASELKAALTYTVTTTTGATVSGGTGNDTLIGAAGNDTFIGGAGADNITLTGAGSDVVKFNYEGDTGTTTATADIITTFATGVSKLSFIGVDAGTAANTTSKVVAATISTVELAVAEANKGDLAGKTYVIYDNATKNYLIFDTDGDGKADGAVELAALTAATSAVYSDIV